MKIRKIRSMITSHTDSVCKRALQEKSIELKDIGKKFQFRRKTEYAGSRLSNEEFWALKGISLDVSRGEVLGVIGRNGAGKSTLLNIIGGTLSPTAGELFTKGRVLGLFNLGTGFLDELSGRENIFLNGSILGASKKEIESKLDYIISFSELGSFIDMPLGTYSQGMRLRLGFSIIINLDFEIMIIDEVLAVGDVLFQNKCLEALLDHKRSGKTMVITSQGMELIERLCEKAVLLDHGKVVAYADAKTTVNKYRELLNNEEFFVGPEKNGIPPVEESKKWADDTANWGNRLGSHEAVIDSVDFLDKYSFKRGQFKTGEPLNIKVKFRTKNPLKEVHFGVAFIRPDGVYAYGPNTGCDGIMIPRIDRGAGSFELHYRQLLLAPGEYRVSVGIMDRDEYLPFAYHCGCYKLSVRGENKNRELADIPYRARKAAFGLGPFRKKARKLCIAENEQLKDMWGKIFSQGNVKIGSVRFVDTRGQDKTIFFTGEPLRLTAEISPLREKEHCFWAGIYTRDKVLCQTITEETPGGKIEIAFDSFCFLPGDYSFSLGIWDKKNLRFAVLHHAAYGIKIVFNRKEHGIVYLKHKWSLKLP